MVINHTQAEAETPKLFRLKVAACLLSVCTKTLNRVILEEEKLNDVVRTKRQLRVVSEQWLLSHLEPKSCLDLPGHVAICEPLLTVEAASLHLECSPKTVERRIQDNLLRAYKFHKFVRIFVADLNLYSQPKRKSTNPTALDPFITNQTRRRA